MNDSPSSPRRCDRSVVAEVVGAVVQVVVPAAAQEVEPAVVPEVERAAVRAEVRGVGAPVAEVAEAAAGPVAALSRTDMQSHQRRPSPGQKILGAKLCCFRNLNLWSARLASSRIHFTARFRKLRTPSQPTTISIAVRTTMTTPRFM